MILALWNVGFIMIKMRLIVLLLVASMGACLDNGLGKTPPMGWNSWNKYNCKGLNEQVVRQTADQLVSTGLAAKGYKYVNLDDCWQADRDKVTNQIIQDKTKFPSGIPALADYIHSKGLLFGLYSDSGTKTCAGRPGSLGYETIDAKTYAKWNVDYLKYDNCNNDGTSTKVRYPIMRDALNASGRHIFFSMCSWGGEEVWTWAAQVGNSWRTTGDITNHFYQMLENLEKQRGLAKYAGPGAWNDPDMLQVGNNFMTHDEYQAHFAFWAALKSPLLIGCSLKGISQGTLQILGNEEVIAVNQDPLGKQIDFLYEQKSATEMREVWGGQLSKNRYVIICFNRFSIETIFSLNFEKLFPTRKVVSLRQIIDKKNETVPKTSIFKSKIVKAHAVAMYVLGLDLQEQENLATQ